MKNIFVIVLISLVAGIVNAQVSYDFAQPLPPGLPQVGQPANKHFGYYKSYVTDRVIEVNSDGIFAHNGIISSLSRSTVRESSKYIIRNNHLFGVVQGDSLPFYADSTHFHFIIPTSEPIVDDSKENILVKISNSSYVINFYENGAYTPCMLTFTNGELRMQYFDYDFETTIFNNLSVANKKEENGLNFLTLNPTIKEFMAIDLQEMFGKEIIFKRQDLANL